MTGQEYAVYLNSIAWRIKSLDAKHRAGWRCQLCNGREHLEVHHRTYERIGREQPTDLIVLCHSCHRRHHHAIASSARRRVTSLEQLELPFVASVPSGPELN